MAEVTAARVKALRDRTGAGMMDCKRALLESDGDPEAAADWLRAKGLAAAAKKAGRVASEGLVGARTDGSRGALVEVNAETDFVARNQAFQDYVATLSALALEHPGAEALMAAGYPGSDHDVADHNTRMIAAIGENISVRRTAGLSVGKGVVASYVHNSVAPGLGKIGVLVALESAAAPDKLAELGKQLAMHVAAASPQAATIGGLDPDIVERERKVLSQQAEGSGKAPEIVAKMVEGRLRKYYGEVVLEEQIFVIDGESRVGDVVEAAAGELGMAVEVAGFVRYGLGEGVARREADFAAEVAAAAAR